MVRRRGRRLGGGEGVAECGVVGTRSGIRMPWPGASVYRMS